MMRVQGLRLNRTGTVSSDDAGDTLIGPRDAVSSLLLVPKGRSFAQLPQYLKAWLVVRAALLPILVALPIGIYWSEMDALRAAWYAPIMGIAACSLPSAGVPVAGGIIFLPMLTLGGVCPRDAVAFSAATQALGVGVFAPLNWLVLNPSVFVPAAWQLAALPACAGVLISLLLIPLQSDEQVQAVYSLFCLVVAAYTMHGLLRDRLDTSDATAKHGLTAAGRREVAIFWAAGLLGGCLTGYIGVSIEKVLFMLLTWRYSVNARAASVTAITLVGWVSSVAFVVHALAPCSPVADGYVGAVPYAHWLMVLPGILIGSVAGPAINTAVGSRRIMIAFVVLLLAEVARYAAAGLGLEAPWSGGGKQQCEPQC